MLYKKIAAMPKEKKTILIVVVIIAVLAGGLLGYRLYVTAKHSVEDVIDAIFYMSDTNYKSEMIRGDFSKQYDEMEQKFRKEHVAKQPEIDKNKEGHVK